VLSPDVLGLFRCQNASARSNLRIKVIRLKRLLEPPRALSAQFIDDSGSDHADSPVVHLKTKGFDPAVRNPAGELFRADCCLQLFDRLTKCQR
jgi:hypothetical protein